MNFSLLHNTARFEVSAKELLRHLDIRRLMDLKRLDPRKFVIIRCDHLNPFLLDAHFRDLKSVDKILVELFNSFRKFFEFLEDVRRLHEIFSHGFDHHQTVKHLQKHMNRGDARQIALFTPAKKIAPSRDEPVKW